MVLWKILIELSSKNFLWSGQLIIFCKRSVLAKTVLEAVLYDEFMLPQVKLMMK